MPKTVSPEYQTYKVLEHWRRANSVRQIEKETAPLLHKSPLFSYLYGKTKKEYRAFPRRKNDQDPFLHPLNVILDLQKAKADEELTLCTGLIHDFIEEKVELFKITHHLKEDQKDIPSLDRYETEMLKELEEDLKRFCKEHHLSLEKAQEIIHTLQILTRHKRDFYYRSISAIFSCPYQNIKESAIKIKLADRTHNIQCLDSFTGKQKIYQCFKNLFILNNTKQFLLQKFGPTLDPNRSATGIEKLFKKCAKATYDAFLTVCRTNLSKGITPVESMLELAFKKYAWERAGWWTVTSIAENETHLMRLYQGIIRKYDARLHQEWKRLDELEKMEKEYCRKFFQDYQFSSEQIEAILEYKDAYALKEVIARLLYKPNFVISGFACSHLCSRYKSCIKRRKGGAFPR